MDLLMERWDGRAENFRIALCPNAQVDPIDRRFQDKSTMFCLYCLPLHWISHKLTLCYRSYVILSTCPRVQIKGVQRERDLTDVMDYVCNIQLYDLGYLCGPMTQIQAGLWISLKTTVWAKVTKIHMPMASHICFIVQ